MMKFLLAGLFVLALFVPNPSPAATYSVNWFNTDQADNNTSDDLCDVTPTGVGRCTLRAAIMQANSHDGADTIVFSELTTNASTVITIYLDSALPEITDQTFIDGRTASGYNSNSSVLIAIPRIYISGSGISDGSAYGFKLTGGGASDSQINAMGVIDFDGNGIMTEGSAAGVYPQLTGIHLSGNWIGVDSDGSIAGNGDSGVRLSGCIDCKVGGALSGPTENRPANLISNNVESGIYIASSNGSTILDNLIGVDPAGNANFGNGSDGVYIFSSGTLVQGNNIRNSTTSGVAMRIGSSNEISDNDIFANGSFGIRVGGATGQASNNLFQNNKIYENQTSGVFIDGNANEFANNEIYNNGGTGIGGYGNNTHIHGNEIGMSTSGENKGNVSDGIAITGSYTIIESNWIGFNRNGIVLEIEGNSVCGNHIGVGESGEPAGNVGEGIWIQGNNNLIGDNRVDCAANVIGNNGSDGVEIWGGSNVVRNNQIGGTQEAGFGNHRGGVLLHEADAISNEIAENEIFHNANQGVRVSLSAGTGNRIERNTFKANGGINIDLGDNGATPNDVGDPDTGPNNLQNSPVITAQNPDIGKLQVSYGMGSTTTHSAYPIAIDFYIDGASTGDRKTFIQRDSYNEAPNSIKNIVVTLPTGVTVGTLAAMATDANGNSSEFSFPFPFTTKTEDIFEDGFEEIP